MHAPPLLKKRPFATLSQSVADALLFKAKGFCNDRPPQKLENQPTEGVRTLQVTNVVGISRVVLTSTRVIASFVTRIMRNEPVTHAMHGLVCYSLAKDLKSQVSQSKVIWIWHMNRLHGSGWMQNITLTIQIYIVGSLRVEGSIKLGWHSAVRAFGFKIATFLRWHFDWSWSCGTGRHLVLVVYQSLSSARCSWRCWREDGQNFVAQ